MFQLMVLRTFKAGRCISRPYIRQNSRKAVHKKERRGRSMTFVVGQDLALVAFVIGLFLALRPKVPLSRSIVSDSQILPDPTQSSITHSSPARKPPSRHPPVAAQSPP